MSPAPSFHENLARSGDVEESSDRAFGFVFAAVFAGVGLLPLVGEGRPRVWALGLSAAFAAVALVRPLWLAPLKRAWLAFGALLHRVVSPVILGAIFYLCFAPWGWVMRLAGKRPLQLDWDPEARTYWTERKPPGPPPGSMEQQF